MPRNRKHVQLDQHEHLEVVYERDHPFLAILTKYYSRGGVTVTVYEDHFTDKSKLNSAIYKIQKNYY